MQIQAKTSGSAQKKQRLAVAVKMARKDASVPERRFSAVPTPMGNGFCGRGAFLCEIVPFVTMCDKIMFLILLAMKKYQVFFIAENTVSQWSERWQPMTEFSQKTQS
ncbi:MAG: hypothetical protein J1D88_03250 [Treponema sp.]|nr:hypothetical protein [Treponema sp.]